MPVQTQMPTASRIARAKLDRWAESSSSSTTTTAAAASAPTQLASLKRQVASDASRRLVPLRSNTSTTNSNTDTAPSPHSPPAFSSNHAGIAESRTYLSSDSINTLSHGSRSKYGRERADSYMSTATTATSATAVVSKATIATASSATIRRIGKGEIMAARPVKFAPSSKSKAKTRQESDSNQGHATDSSASSHHYTESNSTNFDHTIHTPATDDTSYEGQMSTASSFTSTKSNDDRLAEPKSFFSDSYSNPRDLSVSNLQTVSPSASRSHLDASRPSLGDLPRSASARSASSSDTSSFGLHSTSTLKANPSATLSSSRASNSSNPDTQPSYALSNGRNASTAIRGRIGMGGKGQSEANGTVFSRPNLGLALDVVPEFGETCISLTAPSPTTSPYNPPTSLSSSVVGQAQASSGRPRAPSNATSLSHVDEPVWGQNSTVARADSDTPVKRFHSFNQSSASSNGWGTVSGDHYARLPTGTPSNLSGFTKTHQPPSSVNGSVQSLAGVGSSAGSLPSLLPTSRDDMLARLSLDQARVDCQSYATMSLEEVAQAKNDLKRIESKIASLRTKLTLETKIRDAAVTLRRAHRTTPSVSPSSGVFPSSGSLHPLDMASPDSASTRARSPSISASEAKADADVATDTASVDRIARDLFELSDKANKLRQRILEHQAAALAERVATLESDRIAIEENLPFLTASASFESLAPSASVSTAGAPTEHASSNRSTFNEDAVAETKRIQNLQAELEKAQVTQQLAEQLASERAAALESEQRALQASKKQLKDEQLARAAADTKIGEAQKQAKDAKLQVDKSEAKFRELELAVGAERQIMAERDELFHAFERRLENAEKRLQEQDKRCARMLGKLEGREEMDDLLELIKAGAAGVSKKTKTAGQDIADLLSSLETHIEDLADELTRAGAQASINPNLTGNGSPALRQLEEEVQATKKETHRWKEEAEATKEEAHQWKEETDQVKQLLEEAKSELEAAKQAIQEFEDKPPPSPKQVGMDQQNDKLQQLEAEITRLVSKNGELERELKTARTGVGQSSSKMAGNGIGNLISKFGGGGVGVGGGRKPPVEASPTNVVGQEGEDTGLRDCRNLVGSLVKALPNLETGGGSSPVDLVALRTALEALPTPLPQPQDLAEVDTKSSSMVTKDLKREIGALTEKLNGMMYACRQAMTKISEVEGVQEQRKHAERMRDEYKTSVDDMKMRIQNLDAKMDQQREKEKDLEESLAEARDQLQWFQSRKNRNDSHTSFATSSAIHSSPSLGSPGFGLGLSTPLAQHPNANGVKTSPPGGSGSRARATLNPNPLNFSLGYHSPNHIATLAPPRSPLGVDGHAWPARTMSSVHSSPSIRYIPPFASTLETRTGGKAPETMASGEHHLDSLSIRSSPSLGLASGNGGGSAYSLSSINSKAAYQPRLKRTMTLGMDVPQLVSRIRDLEREMAQTASVRKQAEKVVGMEIQLREAHESLNGMTRRMEDGKRLEMQQRAEMLNELNDAQSQLETVRARMRSEQRKRS